MHLPEIQDILGPQRPQQPTTNLDRYGFAHVLARRLGMPRPLRPFCHWVHGWAWWDDLVQPEDLLGPRRKPRDLSIVVGSDVQKRRIEREGYTNVRLGGTPFAYVEPQGVVRRPDTLLAFIAHSAEAERMDVMDTLYLDHLASLASRFEVHVSVFSLDHNDHLIDEITRRGLHALVGADPRDRNSMLRTRRALELFEHVSTNTFGSHIAYALAAGARVSVFSPTYQYDVSRYVNTVHGFGPAYAERMALVHSEAYLRERFPLLFTNTPEEGLVDMTLGMTLIGAGHALRGRQLRVALGWTLEQQIQGYSLGAWRRMQRLAASLMGPERVAGS